MFEKLFGKKDDGVAVADQSEYLDKVPERGDYVQIVLNVPEAVTKPSEDQPTVFLARMPERNGPAYNFDFYHKYNGKEGQVVHTLQVPPQRNEFQQLEDSPLLVAVRLDDGTLETFTQPMLKVVEAADPNVEVKPWEWTFKAKCPGCGEEHQVLWVLLPKKVTCKCKATFTATTQYIVADVVLPEKEAVPAVA